MKNLIIIFLIILPNLTYADLLEKFSLACICDKSINALKYFDCKQKVSGTQLDLLNENNSNDKIYIYSSFDKAKIVDISNNVSPFNIMEAAYILENTYKIFPENSVHIIDVDSETTIEKKHIVMCLDNHFFISADNGILSILCQNINPEKIFEITIHD